MPLRHCERSEAIHLAAQRKNGLLRRCAPRNDGGARASPHCEATSRKNARPLTGSAKQSTPLRHCERSEAIHLAAQRKTGLLRRFAPLRKRFAFVAGNDGGPRAPRHCLSTSRTNARRRAPRSNPCLSVIASAAKQSISPRKERLD